MIFTLFAAGIKQQRSLPNFFFDSLLKTVVFCRLKKNPEKNIFLEAFIKASCCPQSPGVVALERQSRVSPLRPTFFGVFVLTRFNHLRGFLLRPCKSPNSFLLIQHSNLLAGPCVLARIGLLVCRIRFVS